ncbi:hypothetical protein HYV89_04240 [Candidatus Woesearchaeota archaeon]|nr:hypothetical protein [Candidatus Woesearchaeota archaeon]
MSEIQRINITLPKKLLNRSKILVDEGLYSNFSELVRESLKNEILLDGNLVEDKKNKIILGKLFEEELGKGEDTSNLSRDELVRKIRKTRDKLWEEKYKRWFKRSAS